MIFLRGHNVKANIVRFEPKPNRSLAGRLPPLLFV